MKFWLVKSVLSRYFLTTLSIKKDGYASLIRLDLMFSMSFWKEFQLLQFLKDLSIKHLIMIILYENNGKNLKGVLHRSIWDMGEVWDFDFAVIFIKIILSFMLSRKIINICDDIALKYKNVIVKDSRKTYEKLECKKKKIKLDIDFLKNWKQLGVYPKVLIFNLVNVSIKDAWSSHKRLLCSAISNCNKEL